MRWIRRLEGKGREVVKNLVSLQLLWRRKGRNGNVKKGVESGYHVSAVLSETRSVCVGSEPKGNTFNMPRTWYGRVRVYHKIVIRKRAQLRSSLECGAEVRTAAAEAKVMTPGRITTQNSGLGSCLDAFFMH